MSDCDKFIDLLNQYLPAPTCSHPTWLHAVRGSPEGSNPSLDSAQRASDAAWRFILTGSSSSSNNSGSSGVGSSSAGPSKLKIGIPSFTAGAGAGVGVGNGSLLSIGLNGHDRRAHGITIGRIQVSTQDRWRIQANSRKEGEKKGLSRTEYNKAVTRAVINVKGPTGGPGFPPGRGRPI